MDWEKCAAWQTELLLDKLSEEEISLRWEVYPKGDAKYKLYWSDRNTKGMQYRCIYCGENPYFCFRRSTHISHYFRLALLIHGEEFICATLKTPVGRVLREQLENLNRGLVAMCVEDGIFLSWRLMRNEVSGYTKTGLSGINFKVLRNGKEIGEVYDSTNYLDPQGKVEDLYEVCPILDGEKEGTGPLLSEQVRAFPSGKNYYDLPVCRPAGGVTPAGEAYEYHINDMSVGDVDGDGDYE